MVLITIDGNIGSGKSTCISKLKSLFPQITVLQEEIKNFNPWLKLYYSDMNRYAMGFQMEVLLSHLEHGKIISENSNSSNLILSERSPLSCIHVFGEFLLKNNILCAEEQDLCIRYNEKYGWMPDHIIYIQTKPENCFKRVQKRNRINENDITLDYLKNIGQLYDQLYINKNIKSNLILPKILVINGNQTIEKVVEDIKNILSVHVTKK